MSLPDAALDAQLDMIRLFHSGMGEHMARMLLGRHEWEILNQDGRGPHEANVGPTFARVFDTAPTYAITAEMMKVVEAGHRFLMDEGHAERLNLDWLPSTAGFVWLATPFMLEMAAPQWETGATELDRTQPKRPVHGLWWTTNPVGYRNEYMEQVMGHGVNLGVVCATEVAMEDGTDLTKVPYRWLPFDMTAWTAEMDWRIGDWEEWDAARRGEAPSGVSTWSGASWRFLMQAVWSLLNGTVEVHHASRPAKRRAERIGAAASPTFGEIRVVTLRRARNPLPAHQGEDTDGPGFEYSHRFVVNGHWRWQAHGPGRAERKLIWIDSFIKGPEHKPLIVRDTVNLLRR